MITAAHVDTDDRGGNVLTVDRGMQVLRAFRAERAALTNTELVRRTGLSKATVSRLTSTLLQLGFIRHASGQRSFELEAGPFGIGHAFHEASEVVRVAQPLVQVLAEHLGGSAALAIPDGLDMVYIAYGASRTVSALRLGVGSVLSMAFTATGRAYLWGLPAEEREEQLVRVRRRADTHREALERGLAEAFSDLDAGDVCCVSSGVLRDTYGFALPVRLGRQRVLMGLSCGKAMVNPDLVAERRRVTPALRQAAAQLEGLLANADGHP